ncbi:MAG: MerR family transcriptional regulator [Acidimicrobiia bacterium]
MAHTDASLGFRSPQVCTVVGITYRQLDYWDRSGLLGPSVRSATGSGTQRLYSFEDIVTLRLIKRLSDAGTSLQKIRAAFEQLDTQMGETWRQSDITLLSDGSTIYAATSPEEVVDLFRKGQGVFGIAVGVVQHELAGEIYELFPDHAQVVAPSAISGAAGT